LYLLLGEMGLGEMGGHLSSYP